MIKILTTTNPTLILNENPKRKRVKIQMQPFDVDANNTGTIHIGTGYQPVATVGHASQGEVLLQGAAIEEPYAGEKITKRFLKAIWATSSAVNQTLMIEEEVEE